ncbi:predicted protein [Phaeodactylum tricornutum CCAP 1055/1]|jgi:TatD family-associated radical SAM protein|uniref:Radical SAM core domain-containing protein n=1 Tax=Phaeodactylum tricornutum (strain CCAP 1055/1) TaxID=556484 RepID=B7G5A2_PHATC|nr:predicted protein [Phaeodactylum tricornutum CCAP 1055/1]EEC46282.1 predicted protein [Phaeodactylum tricornutum CCAP 1055/1]|eukprot:XP_002182381.1 predicted protein [Phaeodactylum tricornutum CCAP 1055/1]
MKWTKTLTSCFTYRIGKSLYVPLTSRCNSRTLPLTRGPNFLLPPEVVVALCRVRDAEGNASQWKHWCIWLETQERKQKLPEPSDDAFVVELPSDFLSGRPTVEELLMEIQEINLSEFESIVIAGEGEPTLRFNILSKFVQHVQELCDLPVRLSTNGLLSSTRAKDLVECGVDSVSVALMTSDADQYDNLMNPQLPSECSSRAHQMLCDFVIAAQKAGLQVELTAIDRPEVDREQTQALSTRLAGVDVRWRSYFP